MFWSNARTRDNRRFPGTSEKTLPRQSLESVSEAGTIAFHQAGEEGEDPLQWLGVSLDFRREEAVSSTIAASSKPNQPKPGSKVKSQDPGVVVPSFYIVIIVCFILLCNLNL